jgi:PAS domain S-box-containing protein
LRGKRRAKLRNHISTPPEAQKAAEAEIERFREQLGPFVTAAETTRMPMLFTDARSCDSQIIFANNSFLALTGFDRNEVLGQSFESLIARGTDLRVLAQVRARLDAASDGKLAATMQGNSETDPQIHYRRKDGTEFWAAIYISPVKNELGQIRQHFVSLVDQTLRIREQEQGELLMGELHHRVNNTLATVDSMARQSSERASPPEGVHAFSHGLASRSILALAVAILLVLAVGVLDYVSTPVVALGTLYMLAIALAAWKVNRTAGLLVAIFALITWAAVEHIFDLPHASPWIILWNVAARGLSFVLVALLVSSLCEEKQRQVAINQQLQASIDAADRSARRARELQSELQLICSWTNRIQSEGRWMRFEEFMTRNFDLSFTHGISKEAAERVRKLV